MEKGHHTRYEIMSQPKVWESALNVFADTQPALDALLATNTYDRVIVTGCGSTHYLSMTGARLLRQAGLDASVYPASELILYPESIYLPQQSYLLIAVSRSGTTSETVRAVEQFKAQKRGHIITVTCDSTSPLAADADVVFAIDDAQEESVAQTRSFSSMAVVLQQIAGHISEQGRSTYERLPQLCDDLLSTHHDLAKALGENEDIQKFFFLGTGALYGIASEAMLKMKEMSLSYSEVFNTMEFRHGPMSMVGKDSLVIGLITETSAKHEIKVLEEMQDMGATILAIGQRETKFEHQIKLTEDLSETQTPILYLPVLQLIGYYRALFNEQNPDNPHNLTAVISLDSI